jgi:hypothetical protein
MAEIDTRYEEHAMAGQEIIADTADHTGHFTGLLVIEDAVVSEVVFEPGYSITGDWTSFSLLKAGLYLPGRFKQISLASGKAIAIKRNRTP